MRCRCISYYPEVAVIRQIVDFSADFLVTFGDRVPEEAVIFLAVLALATDVGIFCSGIRQNSCLSSELQDFWQSPLRFDFAIDRRLIPRRDLSH